MGEITIERAWSDVAHAEVVRMSAKSSDGHVWEWHGIPSASMRGAALEAFGANLLTSTIADYERNLSKRDDTV